MMNVNCFDEYVPCDVQTNIYLKVSLSDVKHSFHFIKNVGNFVYLNMQFCHGFKLVQIT
jgi:glycerol-3-phosphate responsive antiterminator